MTQIFNFHLIFNHRESGYLGQVFSMSMCIVEAQRKALASDHVRDRPVEERHLWLPCFLVTGRDRPLGGRHLCLPIHDAKPWCIVVVDFMSIDLHDPQQIEDHDPEHNPVPF